MNDHQEIPNHTIQIIVANNKPHLHLFAVKGIETGADIESNFGNSKRKGE